MGPLSQSVHIEKSYIGSGGIGGSISGTAATKGGGAFGVPNLDTSFKNILSTPSSSNRSEAKSQSNFSPEGRNDK